MQFLNPWLLLGLLGVSIPIVIHLLNRFRYRDIDWAAMDLLRRALVVRARRVRLEDLILLVLRCAVLALLALAIARPTLTPEGGAAWAPGGADVGAVVAIDASFSMAHKPGVYSRFDDAIERTREVLKTFKPGDPVTVVLLGSRPRVLFRNTGYEADRLDSVLQAAAPLPEKVNLEGCLKEIEGLVSEIKAPVRECFLVTDAQTATWSGLSEPARASLGRIAESGRVFFVPVPAARSENLSVVRFECQSGVIRRGELAHYVAAVRNCGDQPRQRVTVTLYWGDKAVDQRIIDRIEPSKTEDAPLYVRFTDPGPVRLSVKIVDDDLPLDNVRSAVADIRAQVRVLCIEGAAITEAGEGESQFLCAALELGESGTPQSQVMIDRVGWQDLASRRLSDYHVAALIDVPGLADEQVEALGQFVDAGGGLLCFLGPNTQPGAIHKSLQFQGGSLLPGKIREAVGQENEKAQERWPEPVPGHPVAQVLAGLSKEFLSQVLVRRYFPLELAPGARSVVKLGSGDEEVLVAEKPLGRGRVVLLTSTADRAWNDLSIHPVYPMLLNGMLTFLGRAAHERPLVVGETLALPLPLAADRGEAVATFHAPGGAERSVQTIRRDGQVLAELGATEQPGFYEVGYSGATAALPVAVNVDPAESNVHPLADAAVAEALRGLLVNVVRPDEDLKSAIERGRIGREIWWELMLLAFVVLLSEGYLAYWFTRRAAAEETPASDTRRAATVVTEKEGRACDAQTMGT